MSRFEEAFTVIRTLLREGRIEEFEGRFFTLRDCVLDPRGPREGGPPLLVGSTSPRMLRITMPHVQGWNAWFNDYGNDPARYPELVARVHEACAEVGRDPAEVELTAALLVQFGERPARRGWENPVGGTPEAMAEAVLRLHGAGASHVQLVLDPITLESIDALGPVLELVGSAGVRG